MDEGTVRPQRQAGQYDSDLGRVQTLGSTITVTFHLILTKVCEMRTDAELFTSTFTFWFIPFLL